ncbi:MAG: peptide chain release factor N(5)-glutamine methyltransferase [Ignavibacteria bacterium]|jgi:release factor glutamine methyltransferase|nr:peptide chain release factor N(5)-glutamine methyltransferase [Ignavibacteria bacterium]
MAGEKLTTLLEILNYSAVLLKENGIKDARLNAELMLASALDCDRMKLYLDFDKPLTVSEKENFKSMLRRRLKHEPVQYILGKTNFYGYNILVSKDVLIPRPDTEILVEVFLNHLKTKNPPYNIIEIGTGSGCITVAVCKELEKINAEYFYLGTDISDNALYIANQNLELNKAVNYKLIKSDFLKDFSISYFNKEFAKEPGFIISNPPYISLSEYRELDAEVREFEPACSLTDNSDGYTFYRKFLEFYKEYSVDIFLEIAYNQKQEIVKLLQEEAISFPEFIKDLNGIYRVLKLIK